MSLLPASFDDPNNDRQRVAVIGAGPAGLMAAERLAAHGIAVDVFDAMPSAGRKFLMAGKGGMNLTHSEAYADFLTRYDAQCERLTPSIDAFSPETLREWVHALGVDTFVGTSGRVFPTDMKAAPMLRAWLHRLREAGVRFHMRHKWVGWDEGEAAPEARREAADAAEGSHDEARPAPLAARITLRFANTANAATTTATTGAAAVAGKATVTSATPDNHEANIAAVGLNMPGAANAAFGLIEHHCDAVVLALGGASWPRLGSDAAWVPLLRDKRVPIVDFESANCGFDVDWTPFFVSRFAGQALKNVGLSVASLTPGNAESRLYRQGECMLTDTGIEGGLIYAMSAAVRRLIHRDGTASIHLDLLPGHAPHRVAEAVMHPRGKRSLSSHLSSTLGLSGAKAALLYECLPKDRIADPVRLAAAIKALPLRVLRPRPIAEAISSAGGVAFDALDPQLMIRSLPGVFCAGEMIDWEAPTGGYLLTACLATGRQAGEGASAYLRSRQR